VSTSSRPHTFKIVDHFPVGRQPQHVTPSYDLKTLWVLNDLGDSVTRIDPMTGHKLDTLKVKDPYNMYYTPDGRYAIVVAERTRRLDFRDAQTMKLVESVKVPCRGVDHMDFSANGQYLLASCEFSSELVKVEVATRKVVATLPLPGRAMPQDVRLAPDGSIFYVADMAGNGVFEIDGQARKVLGFIAPLTSKRFDPPYCGADRHASAAPPSDCRDRSHPGKSRASEAFRVAERGRSNRRQK
jgi:DNA-binding beta-propeller fold protein YncE